MIELAFRTGHSQETLPYTDYYGCAQLDPVSLLGSLIGIARTTVREDAPLFLLSVADAHQYALRG